MKEVLPYISIALMCINVLVLPLVAVFRKQAEVRYLALKESISDAHACIERLDDKLDRHLEQHIGRKANG